MDNKLYMIGIHFKDATEGVLFANWEIDKISNAKGRRIVVIKGLINAENYKRKIINKNKKLSRFSPRYYLIKLTPKILTDNNLKIGHKITIKNPNIYSYQMLEG